MLHVACRSSAIFTIDVHIACRCPGTFTIDVRIAVCSGDNEILVTPEGITLRGKQIRIEALEKLDLVGNGPSMSLGEEAEIVAKKVRIYGEASALELDRDAKVCGDKLKLQPPATPAPERDPETNEPKTKPLSLRFLDGRHQPYDGRTYQLSAARSRCTTRSVKVKGQSTWIVSRIPWASKSNGRSSSRSYFRESITTARRSNGRRRREVVGGIHLFPHAGTNIR